MLRSDDLYVGRKKPEYDLYAGYGRTLRLTILGELAGKLRVEASKARDAEERRHLSAAAELVEHTCNYIKGAKR
jgi:hypothetical protein